MELEVLTSMKPPQLRQLKNFELLAYLENTWELYEFLFSSIKEDETYYKSPDPLRNPLIFYLGHTAAFYINKLRMAGLWNDHVNKEWDQLFAVGVDPDAPENLDVAEIWPTVPEVRAYRDKIYEIVKQVIQNLEIPEYITQEHSAWAIIMAMEHDRIHFETSSVLIRQLPTDDVQKPEGWMYAPLENSTDVPPKWITVDDETVSLGKPTQCSVYGWDNEYGQLDTEVKRFRAMNVMVTNAQFLGFVRVGGYQKSSFWSEEGWQWKEQTKTTGPKFWLNDEGETFRYRAMFDEIEMPLQWPVEVNAYEAEAFCNWIGHNVRLLTEAEFKLIAQHECDEEETFPSECNDNFTFGSPTPVGFVTPRGNQPFYDLYGNVWDWLQDDFYSLPGFKTHPLYEEFSAPYMDDEHGMMAGGSWATTGTGCSKFYRLWFRRHFFQHAGFRLAQSL